MVQGIVYVLETNFQHFDVISSGEIAYQKIRQSFFMRW